MTVRELIETLKEIDPDLHVFVNGYEGGFNDVKNIKNIEVVPNYHESWYYGRHEDINRMHPDTVSKYSDQIVKGIVL